MIDERLFAVINFKAHVKAPAKKRRPKSADDTQAAMRALRRAVKKVHAENRKLGLPIIIWRDGKVVSVPA